MKYIYLLLITLFSFTNVYASEVNMPIMLTEESDDNFIFEGENIPNSNANDFCNSEYLEPFTNISTTVINIIKIGVPIILVIFGMIDLGKAVASQKEEKIKDGQKTFLHRCLNAAIVFFVVAIVQLVVSIISNSTGDSTIWNCACKFVGGCSNG